MLPTTLRRLVDAVTVGAIGPLIEPTLSAWQAARRGGSCRQNIQMAVRQLEPPVWRAGETPASLAPTAK
eukprot:497053-Alexandrium_andersonii.AAC.1